MLGVFIGVAAVLLQFLAEAVFLSVTGGIAGIITGIAFSEIIALVTGWQTPIVTGAIVGGFLFSAAVGIFFGTAPGRPRAWILLRPCVTNEWHRTSPRKHEWSSLASLPLP